MAPLPRVSEPGPADARGPRQGPPHEGIVTGGQEHAGLSQLFADVSRRLIGAGAAPVPLAQGTVGVYRGDRPWPPGGLR
jgi:hypothetical protein